MRLNAEAPKKCPRSAACASRWRQPSLFGDDTHAVLTKVKVHGSTDCKLAKENTSRCVWSCSHSLSSFFFVFILFVVVLIVVGRHSRCCRVGSVRPSLRGVCRSRCFCSAWWLTEDILWFFHGPLSYQPMLEKHHFGSITSKVAASRAAARADFVWQEDPSLSHASKSTQEGQHSNWLLCNLWWPPISPDLSPLDDHPLVEIPRDSGRANLDVNSRSPDRSPRSARGVDGAGRRSSSPSSHDHICWVCARQWWFAHLIMIASMLQMWSQFFGLSAQEHDFLTLRPSCALCWSTSTRHKQVGLSPFCR